MPKTINISGRPYTARTTENGPIIMEPSTPPPAAGQLPMYDEEDPEDYNPGGYLNVKVGREFVSPNRGTLYTAVRKLGWGHFSTVWLALNEDDGRYVALKVSSARYTDTAKDEISLLMKVRDQAFRAVSSRNGATHWEEHPGAKHVVSLLDYFSTRGRYKGDSHLCLVFNPLGENLLNLLERHRTRVREDGREEPAGVPMNVVKSIAKQVLLGLHFLHDECGLVHTDIKPENILLGLPNTQEYIRAQLASSPTHPSQRVSIPSQRSKRSSVLSRKAGYVDMYFSQPITSPRVQFESRTSDHDRLDRRHGSDDSPNSRHSRNSRYEDAHRSRSRASRTPSERRVHGQYQPFPVDVQISDLGNATPVDTHFTEDIQTRQYRSPEAIIRRKDWGFPVDIWSVACLVFELLTGDHLFDPRSKSGLWDKDDDHMGQIIELCGDFDLRLKMGGKYSRDIFTSKGYLRHIRHIKPVSLARVLTDNYNYRHPDARQLSDFLLPMLSVDPELRATAQEMMRHEWVESWHEDDAVPRTSPQAKPKRKRRNAGYTYLEHPMIRNVMYK